MSGHGETLHGPRKAGVIHPAPGDAFANMKQMLQQGKLRELSHSPEEQVERARQNGASKMRLETDEESN
jgi:hypothetical protein